ncbi:MAG: asparagine synthase (glutamine-hydrolyzing) [Cellulosilyticaceae bacterium]
MCSICGIINLKEEMTVTTENILKEMGHTLTHRGPDQQGHAHFKHVGLWHNRLAIIDVALGRQPMEAIHGGNRYTIVYNGELYNTDELRQDLIAHGITFKTHCDTEVVLYSYIVYGDACSDRLNGIFAFAIYDEKKDALYLSRDRFGIKPFFYAQVGNLFLFASEIKGLLAHPALKGELDQEGIWQLLFLLPVKLTGTSCFKNIHEISPAHHGYYSREGLRLTPYWKLSAYVINSTEQEIVTHTKDLLTDAITRQLVSDVPLCTFLSGGLDSSIISSVAAKHYAAQGQKLTTYSFEHEDNKKHFHSTSFQPQSDDDYAIYMAQYLGTNHHVLTASVDDTVRLLFDAVHYRDLPGMADIDSSLLYYCKQVQKDHTVALSGECSDEVFGGYPWFYKPEMQNTGFFPWIHDPFVRVNLFDHDFTQKEQGFEYLKAQYEANLKGCPTLAEDTPVMRQNRYATWLSTQYFMTSLLERKDRMSMGTSLEVRVPFADHRLVEYVFNVPWEIKFKNQVEKSLLRESMADYLPDPILNRKKSPYPKTHNPLYENTVLTMLQDRLSSTDCKLKTILNRQAFDEMLTQSNTTWFGQLMSKPQLIAWLLQLDFWLDAYHISL